MAKERKPLGKRWLKWALIPVAVLLGIHFLVMPVVSVFIYESIFAGRDETAQWMKWSAQDFDGLTVENCSFPTKDGTVLAGYHYSKPGQSVRGVLVISHGLGAGHNTYMDVADYFTSNGYLVFAYDATACDGSAGENIGGLPQGVIDLTYALGFVKTEARYKGLPIVLFGHSWGANCVGTVLNFHPDVEAVVMMSGFNESENMLLQEGRKMVGPMAEFCMMYVLMYEELKFGEYARVSAMSGFEASDAAVMVLHSADDTTVEPQYGYELFYETYGTSDRFEFLWYEDRGHSRILYSAEAEEYRLALNEAYTDYVAENGGKYTAEVKQAFMEENLDKAACYAFDEDVMERILEFCDRSCQ